MRVLKPAFIFLLMLLASLAHGRTLPLQEVPRSKDLGAAADGIQGIVVNQTLSQNGYEFYRIFSLLWSENPDSGKYSLLVRERLSKRYGNQIIVYMGQKQLYSGALPRKYDELYQQCLRAVEQMQTGIISIAMELSDDEDIVREEL